MIIPSFKITFLGAASIALLALCHAKDESNDFTLEKLEELAKDYGAHAVKPTKTYYQCRSDCYNDALRNTLGKDFWGKISRQDRLRYEGEVALVDACVAVVIKGFTSFEKIVEYEKKRGIHEFTVSQYCVDEVLNPGKGVFDSGIAKVPLFKIPGVQYELGKCSVKNCDLQYASALAAVKDE